LLATGVEGEQAGQTVTVTYTDGTTSQFTQSFSDWFTPDQNPNEAEAVAMPYRNVANGTQDDAQFNLYNYTFVLNSSKTVKSFTLPNNRDVVVLAATLTEQYLGDPVSLTSAFNADGIYTDGTTFDASGGLDGGGAAYSANLLGNASGAIQVVEDGVSFNIAQPNAANAVYGAGAAIALPAGHFSSLRILGTGVQGDQTSQVLTVTYTDGTTQQITQNFSDWYTPGGYPDELDAIKLAYRDYYDGTEDTGPFNVYEYTLSLNRDKVVKSITLPINRDVLALAITLVDDSRVPCRHWW
jgi:hypothetical protein